MWFHRGPTLHYLERQVRASGEWRHGAAVVAQVPPLWVAVVLRHEEIVLREQLRRTRTYGPIFIKYFVI